MLAGSTPSGTLHGTELDVNLGFFDEKVSFELQQGFGNLAVAGRSFFSYSTLGIHMRFHAGEDTSYFRFARGRHLPSFVDPFLSLMPVTCYHVRTASKRGLP